jgi:putative acetyltransferase
VYVRDAEPGDAVAAMTVLAAVAEEDLIATEPPVDIEQRASAFRGTLAPERPGRSWVVCTDDGEVVGSLGLHETPIDGVLSLGVAIAAGHRGGGGGRMLMERALRWARSAPGVHKVELEVWLDNQAAITYYEALGFEREGVRRDHYRRRDGSLRSAVLMAAIVGS